MAEQSRFSFKSTTSTVQVWAAGKVTGATGAVADAVNVTSVTHTGAGTYDIVIASLPVAQRNHLLTLHAPGLISIDGAPGATTFSVDIKNSAGAQLDADFEFVVLKIAAA